jgi:AGZA family xanthine/uracil permease-like MFS transporter
MASQVSSLLAVAASLAAITATATELRHALQAARTHPFKLPMLSAVFMHACALRSDGKAWSRVRLTAVLCLPAACASAVVIGSLLGCAPLTVYIESASGIREGGRTGITAIVVAIGFFVSLFLTPLIASIPPFATGPALILVGAMMMENLIDVDWANVRQAVPAFITVVVMPLTYSIAYGVIAGICSYLFLYLGHFAMDLCEVAMKRKELDQVVYDNCPEAFQVGRI